jgi:hypothetical protein
MATCAADLCGSQFVNSAPSSRHDRGDNVASMAWSLHAIERTQSLAQRRVDGAGRLKFDFRTAVDCA